MKDFLKTSLLIIVCLFAGAWLHKCQSPSGGNDKPPEEGVVVSTETQTYTDTTAHTAPTATTPPKATGYVEVKVPTSSVKRETAEHPRIRADTDSTTASLQTDAYTESTEPDSLTFRLPIEQSVYEDTDYKAYVSGYNAKLDSIFVYPRHETVVKTIKVPPNRKRWHLGLTAGYAMTPKGLQPYLGVGITYSIISF